MIESIRSISFGRLTVARCSACYTPRKHDIPAGYASITHQQRVAYTIGIDPHNSVYTVCPSTTSGQGKQPTRSGTMLLVRKNMECLGASYPQHSSSKKAIDHIHQQMPHAHIQQLNKKQTKQKDNDALTPFDASNPAQDTTSTLHHRGKESSYLGRLASCLTDH